MRAVFALASLLIVLAVVGLSLRHALQANRDLPPTASAGAAASGAAAGSPRAVTSQYRRDVEQALGAGAQHTADQAASAADDVR